MIFGVRNSGLWGFEWKGLSNYECCEGALGETKKF